jgi:hypothetical protein
MNREDFPAPRERVNAEALMIASGQNVERLLAFGTRRPRRVAQAAALRRPEAGRPGFPDVRRHRGRCIWAPAGPCSTGWYILRTSPVRSATKFAHSLSS